MNKRSFFKSLALLAGSASISPYVFIPKFEPVTWKRSREITLITPEWLEQSFEKQRAFMLNFRDLYGKWNFITQSTINHKSTT